MKIRLIANDSKMPNLAIMKISTYHKQLGDDVDWYEPLLDFEDTDILYISKVFTFSDDSTKIMPMPINAKIIKGGTGYDVHSKLPDEIENITKLDYSLYPKCDYSLLFTTRGCIRNCGFCVVPKKEGLIHNVPICDLNPKGKYIKVLDNNFFSNKTWRENLEILKSYNQPLDFNQGIDLRLLNEEQCKALSECKIKLVTCAWDNYKDGSKILPKLKMLCQYVKPSKIRVYVLVGYEHYELVDTDIERVNKIWELKALPFVMVYVDLNDPNYEKARSCRSFARWCNNRFLFKSCTWEEYIENRRNK